jgi:hypothetical protein
MPVKYLVSLLFACCLAGCAHAAPSREGPGPAAAALERPVSRVELLREAGLAPAGTPREKDDFIEVDDKKGFLKTWPMALFVGLLAAAVGML